MGGTHDSLSTLKHCLAWSCAALGLTSAAVAVSSEMKWFRHIQKTLFPNNPPNLYLLQSLHPPEPYEGKDTIWMSHIGLALHSHLPPALGSVLRHLINQQPWHEEASLMRDQSCTRLYV